jgi:hypothetical protein
MTPDFAEGTFGHPWEQSLCVVGERLVETLGRWLTAWLPVLRRDGVVESLMRFPTMEMRR